MLILSCGLAGCQGITKPKVSQQKAQYYMQIGVAEMMRGNFRVALRNLLEAKRLNPTDPVLLNNLGLTYFGMREFNHAEETFKKALNLQKNYTDVRNNLGALYITMGRTKEAIPLLQQATRDLTYDKPAQVWSNLGLAHFRSSDYPQSQKNFLKALEYDPQHCEATLYYGRALFESKSYKKSADALDLAVNRCKIDEPFFYSALAYAELKQSEKAAGRLRELLGAYPESTYATRAKKLLEILQ